MFAMGFIPAQGRMKSAKGKAAFLADRSEFIR
jgi:hypothetical protein